MPRTTTAPEKWRLILVPHTHWDREWYYPFQRYRTRLVGFFDLLLDILEHDPEYKHFLLDGHTILIEDYLEVRPDRRETIERFVREGRLAAGPWFVIPDESLPSGEALVRNILRGHRMAKGFGGAMPVGYIPDPFGQIAHMPAILRGFGIERCTFWRGTDESLKQTELVWESPDGSSVLAVHMPGGYGVAAPFPTDEDAFLEKIELIRSLVQPRAKTRTLYVPWGSDHVPPQRELSHLIRAANRRLPDAEIVHGSLPQLFDEVEAQANGRLPRRRGEFRSGQRAHLLPGVLSARMWIKQRTFACEQVLTRWAEPFTLWSELLRDRLGEAWREPPRAPGPSSPFPDQPASEAGLLDRAWRLLLENQPHDSICGCSVDQTHDEMRPRFDQCEQVGEDLSYQALRRVSAQGPSDRVFVYNPLPGPRSDFVTAVVPTRPGAPPAALVDDRGRRMPCQPVEDSTPEAALPDRATVGFVPRDLPGFGYRTYRLEYGPADKRRATRRPRIENDIFAVEADPKDGTLRVEIKGAGARYTGLNRLVDGGDRGDEYNYCAPDPDALVDRPVALPELRVLESGPARSMLEVRMTYRLPARLTEERRRSRRTVDCPVRVFVSLSPGVPRIDVRTEFENHAEDHRLRAHFPSGVATDLSHAEQHFGVISRPVALPEADDTWVEQPVGTHPQKTFVDVNHGHGGLLVANRGLPEYEVLDTRKGGSTRLTGTAVIALTLLRCVGWLSRSDFPSRKGHAGPPLATPAAQCPGRHVFEYSIIPHRGGWQRAYAEAHRFATPLRARWQREGAGLLPASASLLDLQGSGLAVTALKRAEDGEGAVVRLYNTLDRRATGRLHLTEPWRRARIVDMKEDDLTAADVSEGWVRLSLRANEIVTLRFE